MAKKNGVSLFLSHAYPAMIAGICARKRLSGQIKLALQTKDFSKFSEAILKIEFPMAAGWLRLMAIKLKSPSFSLKTIKAYWLCDHLKRMRAIALSHNSLIFKSTLKQLKKSLPEENINLLIQGLNSCIVTPGKVAGYKKNQAEIKHQPLSLVNDNLIQLPEVTLVVKTWWTREELKTGRLVSLHQGWICAPITKRQQKILSEANIALVKHFNTQMQKLRAPQQ